MNNKLIPIRVGRSLRLTKSTEFRVYEGYLNDQYVRFGRELKSFLEAYRPESDAIECFWLVKIPKDEFFTKKKTISKTCLDASNAVKILEDVLSKNIGIDDSQVIDSRARKVPTNSNSWSVSLTLSIVDYPLVID